jgi:hypothetical protein
MLRIVDISNFKPDVNPAALDCDGLVVQCTWGAGELTVNGIVNSVWQGADSKIQAAARAGKAVGYMHYIRGVGAEAEAQFFAKSTEGYLRKFVPSVDWEGGDNAAWGNPGYLDRWLAEYIRITNVRPVVYRQRSVAGSVDPIAAKHNCMVWDAMYADMNPTGWQTDPWDMAGYAMRQFTSSGAIGGYNGRLDLSIFVGDRNAWNNIAGGNGSAQAPVPAPAPSNATTVNVHYGLHQMGAGWLGDVKNFNNANSDGFAGYPNHQHDMLYAWVDRGRLDYSVHTAQDGWLPSVMYGDPRDTVNKCAGVFGHAIDGVKFYYTTPKGDSMKQAWYRSQTTQRAGWLGVCCDDGKSVPGFDGFAGILGEPLDRLQLAIASSNPF